MNVKDNMKPIVILPPGAMTDDNMTMLRENGLCVVVAENPPAVKFLDPITAVIGRTAVESAAIELSRKVLNPESYARYAAGAGPSRAGWAAIYIDILVKGTSLQPGPTEQELQQEAFDSEKYEELRRLAREEAKEERAAAKAAKKDKLNK